MLKRLATQATRVRLSDFFAGASVPVSVAVGSLVWKFTGSEEQGLHWTGMVFLAMIAFFAIASGEEA